MRATLLHTLVIVGLVCISASTAFGAGRAGGPVPMTPALKMDMANMYQKMAHCLRTGKSVELCSKEVEKDCPVVKKTGHCPVMEGMNAVSSGKE